MSHDRQTAPAPAAGAADAPLLARWTPCPTCWGQRQIWEPEETSNGEGRVLVPHACPECLGLGEVIR